MRPLERTASVLPGAVQATPSTAVWLDLGRVDYDRAYEDQMKLHSLRLAGEIPDVAVVVEHPPCITFGRAAHLENIVVCRDDLERQGVAVYPTDRGGDVTYHGPGQLVLYPIFDLGAYGKDVHAHARRLEQVLIDTVTVFGVRAYRREEYPGVWTARGKIGALGIKVKRWVTLHGVSLNVSPDMDHFGLIVPCGIRDYGVTSLIDELGADVDVAAVKPVLRTAFESVFGVRLRDKERGALGL